MESDLYSYSSTLKNTLNALYPGTPVLALSCQSQPGELVNSYVSLAKYPDLLEYWACCFLLSCEDSQTPVLESIDIESFLSNFEWALYSVSQANVAASKNALADCIDGVLMNEIVVLDENQKLNDIARLLDVMSKYEVNFGQFDYTYKRLANIAFSSLWGKFKEFNEGDAPKSEVEIVAWQVSVAYKCNLDTDDLSYILADSVLEYIDDINGNNLNRREGHDQSKIQTSHVLILRLEEFVKDEETKSQIQEYKSKLNNICVYLPPNQVINAGVAHNPATLPDDIQSLERSQVAINKEVKYMVTKGNVKIGIYDGNYYNQKVCIKTYHSINGSTEDLQRAYNEIKIYQRLSKLATSNNCFLKYYGSFLENSTIYMVMEWYQYNLMDYIHNLEKAQYVFQEIQYLQIIYKLLDSFKQMSDQGILHNDIKPHNMLVDESWNIKIIDFDISLVKIQDITFTVTGYFKIQGTDGYLSPEQKAALAKKETTAVFNREKSDVYSLGLVFYQLLTYKNVQNLTTEGMMSDINNVSTFSADTKNFLKKMIDPSPVTRPKFSEALSQFKTIAQTRSFTN